MMGCVPAARVEVLNVAVPSPDRPVVPRRALPSLKDTVPVGMPESEVTVAVKTTVSPMVEGFLDEVSEVVVAVAEFTVKAPVVEAAAKFA